jgi:hypothetical protein
MIQVNSGRQSFDPVQANPDSHAPQFKGTSEGAPQLTTRTVPPELFRIRRQSFAGRHVLIDEN